MPSAGAKRLTAWARANGYSLNAVSKKIGDRGYQTQRWTSGDRETLSLRLLCELSELSGISILKLASRKQAGLLKRAFKLSGEG